jgi:hypothetical protein
MGQYKMIPNLSRSQTLVLQVWATTSLVMVGWIGQQAQVGAATFSVSATEAFSHWGREPDPIRGSNIDDWIVSASELHYIGNVHSGGTLHSGQSLVSNFTLSEDFSFTSRIQNLDTDDDRYGLIFGYQDHNNNYRFSWERLTGNGGIPEADSSRGLSLIREVGGVSTSLFNLPSTYWAQNTPYDVTVFRTGDEIGFEVQEAGGTVVASTLVTDTTFLSGEIGLWNSSQRTRYSNLEYTIDVPEPTAILASLGIVLGLICHRNKY